ncbi:hypothetical protein PhCBS80983_g03109 [Powellomyces hirtus]|uniref:RNA helicase n=1 Tax=Powellomyces hirtus TaxID=109895 RepID=A0A507E402_9FUNG|nr:hypothetical protein PhCBS80983_g03109 [Powellomyces hirtus]
MRAISPNLMVLYWAERMDLQDGTVRDMIDPEDPQHQRHALVIEFRDARPIQVKGKKRMLDRNGQTTGWRELSLADQIGPSIGTASIPVLVERRNRNFREFMINFVAAAAAKSEDPIEKLRELALQAVPVQPGKLWAETEPTGTATSTNEESLEADLDRPTDLIDLLEALKQDPSYRGQIGEHALRVDEARVPAHGKLDQPLSDNLTNAIKGSSGIEELYTHQAQAINALESGYNVIVSTSTSSGKSLIYQLPVLRALETDSQVRAMFIFPTKALAQDQKRALTSILSHSTHLSHVHVDTYDGDTPLHGTTRDYIRQNASIIFTNPDMVHLSILPGYKQWKTWLEKLRFVIVDELHYYSGAFGSHCAMIMRRLRRMCHLLGNDQVAFVSCSATVANPAENMSNFFGLPASAIRVVDVDGAPTGRKLHLIWNPPLKDPKRPSQGRCSSLEDAVRLVSYLMDRGVRTICFAKVRQMCEILTKEMQTFLRERAPSLVPKVMSYRGGYTPEDRREIERKMFRGDLLCIVATNALELGVDIGSLDAVIHLGFPFNLASYRQQSGRAGRRERDSISILVAEGDNPLDQFYAGAPHELYDATVETVGVELSNELITDAQLQCAAYEWPIDLERDSPYFGDWESLEGLCTRYLRYDPTWKIYFAQAKYTSHPSRQIAIRSIDEDFWRIIDVTTHRDIEQLEAFRVPFTLYEGSIFLHQGNSYHVVEVNSDQKCAKVRPTLVEYITRPRDYTDVDPVKTVETRTLRDPARFTESPLFVYYGEIKVTTIVFGYFKVNPRTKQRIAAVEGIENPPIIKHRFGFWVNIPDAAISTLRSFNLNVEYSIHAASHALISLVPSYVTMPTAGGGQTDIRTECKHPSATRKRPPRIIVYDGAGKGSLTYKAFKHVGELLTRAAQVVENCPCETGCPGCIHRASCTEHNEALTKAGALVVLKVTSAGVQNMGEE